MYPASVTYLSAVAAGVLVAAALAGPGLLTGHVSLSPGIATLVSWIGWHLLLNATHATGFDVDTPIIGLSWEDVGSGVVALFTTVLILGLVTDRREAAVPVVGAASI